MEPRKIHETDIINDKKIIWFFGLSGSGKTTLATMLYQFLYIKKMYPFILDADELRMGLNNNLGYSREDRKENIRRIAEIAKLFVHAGRIPIVAAITPYEEDRNMVRTILADTSLMEVFVQCPISICEKRDPKGLYKKARNGEIKDFTSLSAPFEEPLACNIIINTDKMSNSEAFEFLINSIMPSFQKEHFRIAK